MKASIGREREGSEKGRTRFPRDGLNPTDNKTFAPRPTCLPPTRVSAQLYASSHNQRRQGKEHCGEQADWT